MSDDRRHLFFDFSDAFRINEDKDILRFMKLSHVAPWDLPRYIPREVCSFYPQADIKTPQQGQPQLRQPQWRVKQEPVWHG